MSIKIAACVILYHPDQSVEHNIKSYINNVEKIYLLDNSETNAFNDQFLSTHILKIVSIQDGTNQGIAKRLNQACLLAIKDGFEYLLTMDQDSFFNESSIKTYLQCIEDFGNKNQVAMFGINHESQTKKENCDCKKVHFLITSGSIISLSLFEEIGAFDENLFIDFVDTEYCFRSIIKGYDLIELPNIFMHHSLGKLSEKRSLKSLKRTKRSFHPPLRLYYMCRNFLYVNSKYNNQFKKDLVILKKDLVKQNKEQFNLYIRSL